MTTQTTRETGMNVDEYRMVASNGRPIRIATKVTLHDGRVVCYTERLSKREAIRQTMLVLGMGRY